MQVKKALMKETLGKDEQTVGGSSVSGSTYAPSTVDAGAGDADKPLAHDVLGWDIRPLHSRIPWEDMQ